MESPGATVPAGQGLARSAPGQDARPQETHRHSRAGLEADSSLRLHPPLGWGNPRWPGPQEEDADGTRSCLEACLGAWLSRDTLGPLGTPVLMSPPSAARVAEAWEGPGASEPRHGRQLLLTA